MTDYKDTLNLPRTDFPMKANLPQREPIILQFWHDQNLYQKLRIVGKNRQKFILHDGPPYANGRLHIGHAINKTLKDIIVKSKTLSHYDAPFVPGWDCHGLPIELNVEKKIGKVGQDVSTQAFIKACREYAYSQIEIQREEFKRFGVFGDWDNPYLTMDFQYEADIIRTLSQIIANGHLQRGSKPVYWCTDCGSALAEAEVEYKDKESSAVDVLFPVIDSQAVLKKLRVDSQQPVAIPIWTTTSWSLPGNEAVALNPTHRYVLVQVENQDLPLLIVAESLLSSVMQRCGFEDYRILAEWKGAELEGIQLHHPFLLREVPVVLGNHVTLDAGTGAVHTAPAHGQDDYMTAVQYKLPIDSPVDAQGIFVAGTPYFAGEHVFKAHSHIIKVLKEHNNLLHEAKILHSYPHCWRHKTPLIYRAAKQWFISMEKNGLREEVLRAITTVKWLPDWGSARMADMVQKRPDWCISRQRVWNSPIPLFVHKKSGELHPDTIALMEQVAKRIEKSGIEAWYNLDARELLADEADYYDKVTDTLDVWFDSGVTHACILAKYPDLQRPADLYLEGSDQYRGWFQSSLLTAVATVGIAPYLTVLTHGFTVDAQGRKMSKSLGNVIAPEQVINRLGADVLRLWVATTDYRAEIGVSNENFERASEAYRRIRNTARFLLSNLHDFDQKNNQVPFEKMLKLDQWAVDCANRLQQEIIAAYDSYQFHLVSQKVHNFCTVEMGSFYLDILKDRLYTMPADSVARRSAQTAMYHILSAMVRWIAPILSFTAEEIWQHMPAQQAESVFLTTWYSELAETSVSERHFWETVMQVRERVNLELERNRNEGLIGSGLAADVTLYCDEKLQKQLEKIADELRFVLITSAATVLPLTEYVPNEQQDDAVVSLSDFLGLRIVVKASPYPKCQRCWHRRQDVGIDPEYPDLCQRCVTNIVGEGEARYFA
jgi:isoleucyl-tRNA synthetase